MRKLERLLERIIFVKAFAISFLSNVFYINLDIIKDIGIIVYTHNEKTGKIIEENNLCKSLCNKSGKLRNLYGWRQLK